jgi:hypothetical protein
MSSSNGFSSEKNIKTKNLRIAAEKDRTKKDSISEIRDIISFQSKASFKINRIAGASVVEKDAFTSPTPTLTGADRVGAVTWSFSRKGGSGKDASMFSFSATLLLLTLLGLKY